MQRFERTHTEGHVRSEMVTHHTTLGTNTIFRQSGSAHMSQALDTVVIQLELPNAIVHFVVSGFEIYQDGPQLKFPSGFLSKELASLVELPLRARLCVGMLIQQAIA